MDRGCSLMERMALSASPRKRIFADHFSARQGAIQVHSHYWWVVSTDTLNANTIHSSAR
ncbi:hypothetical protein E143388_06453 [Rhodococcus opacus]|nr:hypothetical protein E143388_06453 [Rhodococcus opacus]